MKRGICTKVNLHKTNKWGGVLITSRRLEKIEKLISRGDVYLAPQSNIQGEMETVSGADHCFYGMHSMGLKYASYSTMDM